jgi:Flp pilus assembly protein TadB
MKNESLVSLMHEINEHIRATDDKRDKLLSLFVVFVASVLGALVGLLGQKDQIGITQQVIGIVAITSLIIIGQVVLDSMISSRKWHVDYMHCCMIVQSLIFSDTGKVDIKEISKKGEYYSGSFSSSKSFVITQLMIFLCFQFFNAFLFLENLDPLVTQIAFIFAGCLVLWINSRKAKRVLRRCEKEFWENPYKTWIITGLGK